MKINYVGLKMVMDLSLEELPRTKLELKMSETSHTKMFATNTGPLKSLYFFGNYFTKQFLSMV